MDINNHQHDIIKEEEFLNNESTIQEANKLTKLLTDATEKMPLNNENEANTVNVYKHYIIEKDEEFLDNKIDQKTLDFQKDFKHQILLNNFNTEQYINRIICVEDEKEFLDEPLTILKDSNQQVLVKHNNCSIDVVEEGVEEFGHNDSIQDVIEISKTEYTHNKSYVYQAKDLENNSNILESSNDINGLIKDYSCDYCFKSFAQLHHLKTHLSVHTNVYKKLPQKVMKSNVSTESPNHIQGSEHSTQIDKISVNENGDETIDLTSSRFNADNTLKVQNNLSNASQHIQNPQTRNIVNKFPKSKITQMYNRCLVCNKIFNFQRDLIKHAQDIHSNEKALKCRECNKCFSNVLSLSRHFKIHKDISKSSLCKAKSSKAKIAQFESEQVNHEEVFEENDEKEANNEDLLELTSFEENSITNDTPQMKRNESDQIIKISENIIEEYDKNLTTLKSLNNNKTSKRTAFQTNKKHKCKFCLKFFATSYVLKRHLTTHTGERPYYCSLCKRTFSRSDNFEAHKRRHRNSNFTIESNIKIPKLQDTNCTYKVLKTTTNHKKEVMTETGTGANKSKLASSDVVDNMGNNVAKKDAPCLNSDKSVKKYKNLSCTICYKSFKRLDFLESHLIKHTGKRSFVCTICERSFNTKFSLKRHQQKHFDQQKTSKLSVCKTKISKNFTFCFKSFKSIASLKSHLIVHTGERPFSCNICEISFSTKGNLQRHQRNLHSKSKIESNIKITELQVTNCKEISKSSVFTTKTFETKEEQLESQQLNVELFLKGDEYNLTFNGKSNKNSLELTSLKGNSFTNDNQQMQKGDGKQVLQIAENIKSKKTIFEKDDKNLTSLKSSKCKFCLKYFVKRNSLKRHLATHTGKRPYSCSLCKSTFSCSFILKAHKRRHRNSKSKISLNSNKSVKKENKNLACKTSFHNKSNLKRHQQVHNKDSMELMSFKCKFCLKCFVNNFNLKRHLNIHTKELPYSCSLCKSTFSRSDVLKRHKCMHPKKENMGKISKNCTFCFKFFKSIASLKSHLIVHTGERPFSCNMCETSFNRKGNLKRHQRNLHSKSKIESNIRFSCNICEISFSSKGNLQRHQRNLHSKSKIESNIKIKKLQVTNCKEISKSSVCTTKTFETKEQLESQQLIAELFLKEDEYNLTFNGKSNKDSLELTSLKENSFTNDNQQMQKGDGKQVLQITENIKLKKTIFEEDDKNLTSLKSSKCKFCLKYFVNRNSLKRHLATHTGKRPYSCSLCKSTFSCSFILKAHKRRHLNSKSKFSLNSNKSVKKENKNLACKTSFHNKGILKRHQQVHNKDSMELMSFKCKFCLKCFVNKFNLNRHLNIHTKELPYSCSLCKSTFSRSDVLKRHKCMHLKKENMGNNVAKDNAPCSNSENVQKEKNLTCTICSESFKSPCFLKSHLIKHTGERPFSCNMCETSFNRKGNLKRHQRNLHSKSKIESNIKITELQVTNCKEISKSSVCTTKTFETKEEQSESQQLNVELFLKEDEYNLTFNGKSNKDSLELTSFNENSFTNDNQQMQKGDGKQVLQITENIKLKKTIFEEDDKNLTSLKYSKCKFCLKYFVNRNSLKRHLATHTGKRPYSCSLCKSTFSCSFILKAHKRRHLNSKSKISLNSNKSEKKENKSLTCYICFESFKKRSHLKTHLMQHTGKRNKGNLKRHQQVHNKDSMKLMSFKCKFCLKCFVNNFSLKRHLNIHTRELPYSCSLCKSTFSRSDVLKRHKCMHPKKENMGNNVAKNNAPCSNSENVQKENNLTCTICSESFKSPCFLKSHLIKHTGKRPFICTICEISFSTQFSLKRHQRKHFDPKSLEKLKYKRYHYDTKTYADDCKVLDKKCAVCCKIFDNIEDLVNHVNSTHTGETSFKCLHCDVTFRQMRYLRRHYKRNHLNEADKNYNCSYCQKSFVNKYRLKEHEGFHRTALKNKFTCDICSKVFRHRNVFNKHIKTVHSDERPHSCALCDRSYKIHSTLLEHQRVAHLKKPALSHIATENKCAICNKIFKFLPDLAKHVRQNHPNGNPFKCRDCNQTFTKVCSVKRHYKITHKEKLKKINTEDTTASIGNENRITTKLDNSEKVNLASNNGEKVLNIVQNVANNTPVKSMELDINHLTEKNNACEICNKSFDKKTNLKRHLIIHAAQSSVSDEKCDKSNENKK